MENQNKSEKYISFFSICLTKSNRLVVNCIIQWWLISRTRLPVSLVYLLLCATTSDDYPGLVIIIHTKWDPFRFASSSTSTRKPVPTRPRPPFSFQVPLVITTQWARFSHRVNTRPASSSSSPATPLLRPPESDNFATPIHGQ